MKSSHAMKKIPSLSKYINNYFSYTLILKFITKLVYSKSHCLFLKAFPSTLGIPKDYEFLRSSVVFNILQAKLKINYDSVGMPLNKSDLLNRSITFCTTTQDPAFLLKFKYLIPKLLLFLRLLPNFSVESRSSCESMKDLIRESPNDFSIVFM